MLRLCLDAAGTLTHAMHTVIAAVGITCTERALGDGDIGKANVR